MDKQKAEHYHAVLADLKIERNDLDSHIKWVEGRIKAAGFTLPDTPSSTVISVVGAAKYNPFIPKPPGTTIPDMCETCLKDAGKPLHGKAIVQVFAEKGREINIKSVTGSMPQDKKRRFENLGNNTWALREWPEDVKAAYRTERGK